MVLEPVLEWGEQQGVAVGSSLEVAPPSEVGPPSEVAEGAGIGQENIQWVGLGQGHGRGLKESESWMSSSWRRYHRA